MEVDDIESRESKKKTRNSFQNKSLEKIIFNITLIFVCEFFNTVSKIESRNIIILLLIKILIL